MKPKLKWTTALVGAALAVGMSQVRAQIDPRHVGSFNWQGGITNFGAGEFLYGTVTVGSDGRIFSTYFVPR